MCDFSLFQKWRLLAIKQTPCTVAEYLTAVVLSILMINSFTGAHNISVWNSVALSDDFRIGAPLKRVRGSMMMKCKAKLLGFQS